VCVCVCVCVCACVCVCVCVHVYTSLSLCRIVQCWRLIAGSLSVRVNPEKDLGRVGVT
jgi:hypothetical protein